MGDVGALVCLLACFESRNASIISGGSFEEIGGEPVLVGKGRELRFSKNVQAPLAPVAGNRTEIDGAWVEKSGWLEFAHAGSGRIEVRLGRQARALRERGSL